MLRQQLKLAGAAVMAVAVALVLWRFMPDTAGPPPLTTTPDQNVLLITVESLPGSAGLDGPGATGLRFTFAHAHSVETLPSQATILTGRYPFEHRLRRSAGGRLRPDLATIADSARARGLATGGFVPSPATSRETGLARGFQEFDVVTSARPWIERQSGAWFAWVDVAGDRAAADAAVAPLFALAGRSVRPTTVLVTSARGSAPSARGTSSHGLYESALRVPLIVVQVGAGTDRTARASAAPVGHIDILPTVLALLGSGLPRELPGQSLLAAEATRDRAAYFESGATRGVILGKYKLIAAVPPELYDLADDAEERENLADSQPEIRQELERRLASFRSMTAVIGPPSAPRLPSLYATAR